MHYAQILAVDPGPPWAHHGGWWPWGPLFFGLWMIALAAIFVGVWFVARRGHRLVRPTKSTTSTAARPILAERFARGEISADEYDERVSHLRGTSEHPTG